MANDKKQPKGISKTWADINKSAADIGYGIRKNTASDGSLLNFLQSAGNYLMSGEDLPAGQGWGDAARKQYLSDLAKRYPEQAAAEAQASSYAGQRGYVPTPGPGARGYVAPSTTGAAAKPSTSGMATPATIAQAMAKTVGGQRAAEMAAAKAAGLEYTPGQAAGTAQNAAQEAANAKSLDESNAQIQSAYNPVLDFLNAQKKQTEDRYAKNSANLTNIFGALTGLSAIDTKKINDQFASSLTKQKADLEARTAEQRTAQEAGMAQLAQTGAERGNGPALGGSPTATATEQAIGQSNAIQQNWEGLMGAQQANAITDVANRGAGYGQQEIAATNQMTQNLQDALMGIQGQEADVQSQIAQAKISRDQAIASGEADAVAAANKRLGELQLQELKNKGAMDVANLKANASIRLKGMGGTSAPKALKGAAGIAQQAASVGVQLSDVISQYEQAYADAFYGLNPGYDPNAVGAKTPKTPSKDQVLKSWSGTIAGSPQTANRMGPLIVGWADTQY